MSSLWNPYIPNIDNIIEIKDFFYLHSFINTENSASRCKSDIKWIRTDGTDLDENIEARGINLEGYVKKSETECKTLCTYNKECNIIHYHPWENEDFPNCNLKTGNFSAPSLMPNSGGDWALYWLYCASGNTYSCSFHSKLIYQNKYEPLREVTYLFLFFLK